MWFTAHLGYRFVLIKRKADCVVNQGKVYGAELSAKDAFGALFAWENVGPSRNGSLRRTLRFR